MKTFTIYADQLEEVTKRLDKIAAKAARYSIPFAYKVGDEHPQTVRVFEVDHLARVQYEDKCARHTVAAIDIEIECDELIRANGWTVRAKVEHGDKGNIVTAFGDKPALPEWFTAPARCDHCNTNRFRTVTFFCESDEGLIRQVGRACLKDYTGISPVTALMWAEVQDLFPDNLDCTADEWAGRGHVTMFETVKVLAHAYDEIKANGYRKSDELKSTKSEVTRRVLDGKQPSAEALEEAEKIRAWLVDLDTDRDLELNCKAMALAGYAKTKHFGYLAYMPLAYANYLERKAREEKRAAEDAASEHVGTIGQRITLKTANASLLTSWDGMYGTTWLYKFVDETGNVFIWYASRPIDVEDGMTLKATIKDHNERNGVKQTVLTRCKAA